MPTNRKLIEQSLTVHEMTGGDESILEQILDNREADQKMADRAIANALRRGVPKELAIRLYGYRSRDATE